MPTNGNARATWTPRAPPARVFQFQSDAVLAGTGAVRPYGIYLITEQCEAVGVSSVCALRRQFDYLVSTRSPSHARSPCHSPRIARFIRPYAQSVDQLSSNGSSCELTRVQLAPRPRHKNGTHMSHIRDTRTLPHPPTITPRTLYCLHSQSHWPRQYTVPVYSACVRSASPCWSRIFICGRREMSHFRMIFGSLPLIHLILDLA